MQVQPFLSQRIPADYQHHHFIEDDIIVTGNQNYANIRIT